jgi:hypothetical protein
MKIVEFQNKEDKYDLPFNVAQDLTVFMKNDPMFYRKHYFPCMSRMADMQSKGKEIDFTETMRPIIQRAMEEYCKKFDITSTPQSVFTTEDEDAIIEMIKEEEMPQIESGEY